MAQGQLGKTSKTGNFSQYWRKEDLLNVPGPMGSPKEEREEPPTQGFLSKEGIPTTAREPRKLMQLWEGN